MQPLANTQSDIKAKAIMAMAKLEELMADESLTKKWRQSKYAYKGELALDWIKYLQGHLDALVDELMEDEELRIGYPGKLMRRINKRLDKVIQDCGLEEE